MLVSTTIFYDKIQIFIRRYRIERRIKTRILIEMRTKNVYAFSSGISGKRVKEKEEKRETEPTIANFA